MSLAEQLRKLQIPGQAVIQQVSSKNVSLLFDARTAASLDNEAIQNIGYHGFKELLLIDPVFSQFEHLFDAGSVKFQRNLENENVTKKIKKKMNNFLTFLSPYLLLKPAQKALEWLVRRYQCHLWDKEALIACILPFHESNLFGRIIQLFGTEPNNDEWDWLITCQKEGNGFSTQALINYCIGNRNLLSFICKMADNAKEALKFGPKSGLKIIFSFHARMLVSVIDTMSVIGEEMLSFLLPYIHSGLKSQVRDYTCSTYMIITGLSSKTKLMKDVCKAILASILKSMDSVWYEEGLLCFLSVLQFQKVKALSQRIFKLFLDLEPKKSMELLATFGKEYDTSLLVELLIPLLCNCALTSDTTNILRERAVNILKAFIDNLNLSDKQVRLICRNMIEESISGSEMENDIKKKKLIPEKVKLLLIHLSKRYATIFDECIGFYFKDLSAIEDKSRLQRLKEIVIKCLSSEKHHVHGDSDFPLMLSLNHPEPSIRIAAVEHLFSTFKSGVDVSDNQFFVDAVVARLEDDNDDVVKAALKYPKSIIKLLPWNSLHGLVTKLMKRSGHYNINELIVAILQGFAVNDTSPEANEFIYAIFGQLMYAFMGKRNRKLVEALDSIEFDSNNVILNGISKALFHINTRSLSKDDCTEEMVVSAFVSLIDHVADTIIVSETEMDVIAAFWNYVQGLPVDHDLQFIRLMLVITIVEKSPKLSLETMELDFSKYIEEYGLFLKTESDLVKVTETEEISENKTYLFSKYYSCLKSDAADAGQNPLLSRTFFIFLRVIIQSLVNNQSNLSESSLAKQKLFSILSSCALNGKVPCYRDLLNKFLAGVFTDKGEILLFLCSLYAKLLDDVQINDESFKAAVCSLHITKRLLTDGEQKHIEKGDCILYATHVALLSTPFPMVREVVLDNISVMADTSSNKVWSYVLKQANESKNELCVDPSYTKKCWQLSFDIKEESAFGPFMKKSKKGKVNTQKISALNGLTKALTSFPVSLQISLIDSLLLVDSKYTMGDYIHVLKDAIEKPETSKMDIKLVQLVLSCIRSEMIESFEELFPLFVKCMNHDEPQVQDSALKLITPTFFNSLSFDLKRSLLEEMLKILQSSSSVVLSTNVRVIIKALDLASEIIGLFLQQFCDAFDQMMCINTASTTNDIQFDIGDDDLKLPIWRALIEILEAVSSKQEASHQEKLVPKVFHALERCLKCSGVEYVKQLLLITLLTITREDLSALSEDQFQVELLVQCLQSSNDTQTSHQCLKVLSNAARFYPTLVLHNIMHIFSFMGGTMLRLDNAYSFEIIEKTINAVVPVLIKKDEDLQARKRPSQSSVDEIVTFILQTFVDSIPHCPEHRRLHIIKHLVDILQEDEYLHMVMILLLKKVSLRHHKHVSEEENMELSPISLEFCKDLFVTYSIPSQVHSLYQMIAYINGMGEKTATRRKKSEEMSEDVEKNDKEANLDKYVILTFTLEVLQNENIQSGYNVKLSKQQQLTHLYLQLIEELLFYSDVLGKSSEEAKSQEKSLERKVAEVMNQLYDLLPFDSFITIISKLLYKENELTRKKSLELLCKKLGTLDENLSETQEYTLLELFKILIALVKYKEENDECATNKQMMLYAIKLVAVKLYRKQKEHFLKAVPVIAQLYTIEDSNQMLSINAMLCVAELSSLLKMDMIPYLPIVMKPLFEKTCVKDSAGSQKGNLVFTSSVTILHTLLKSLSKFCSPFVSDFILNVSAFDVIATELSDTVLMKKVSSLKADIGKLFPPRVLYPAIESCFESLLATDKQRTVSVVDIYRYSFKAISKSDANSNYSKDILNITKTIFNVHSILGSDDDLCDVLENLAIQAFNDLILKLTENTLRPMYLELLNWSTETGVMSRRLLSFFRLSLELSKSLKSLFLLFVGHILKNANDVLTKVNTMNEDFDIEALGTPKISEELVIAVLDTLRNCFFYDSQGFINKERFETIMQPLVNQMENKLHGDNYLSFAKDHLSPCIVNFASVVNDSSCWKQLNHQILTRTKSECENVRLMSLYVIEKVCSHMGESYMILIPETIPFLAEILEDDSLEVEKQCQKVIQVIEEISGESIQKYF